jgi:TRAF-type zinc finger
MAMDMTRFVISGTQREREDLAECTCQICGKITVSDAEPMLCNNEHVFCRACITRHLQSAPTCPVDSAPLTLDQVHYSARVARFASRRQVRCAYHAAPGAIPSQAGCRWLKTVNDVAAHEAQECAYRPESCVRCRERFPRRARALHELSCGATEPCSYCGKPALAARDMDAHLDVCPAVEVVCPNACLVAAPPVLSVSVAAQRVCVPRRDLHAHLVVCPMAAVACPFAGVGCAAALTRGELDEHVTRETQAHILLLLYETTKKKRAASEEAAGDEASTPKKARVAEEPSRQVAELKSSLLKDLEKVLAEEQHRRNVLEQKVEAQAREVAALRAALERSPAAAESPAGTVAATATEFIRKQFGSGGGSGVGGGGGGDDGATRV